MSTRLHIVVSDGLLGRLDGARGLVSRSAFVRGAVEQALVTGVVGGSPGVSKGGLPAPAEQPRVEYEAVRNRGGSVGLRLPAEQPRSEEVSLYRQSATTLGSAGGGSVPSRVHAATCRCGVCVPLKGSM